MISAALVRQAIRVMLFSTEVTALIVVDDIILSSCTALHWQIFAASADSYTNAIKAPCLICLRHVYA